MMLARRDYCLQLVSLVYLLVGHDARKTTVNMDLLIPYQLLVYCFHELLVQNWPKLQPATKIFTTQGRKYPARNFWYFLQA